MMIESMLVSMIAEERKKVTCEDGYEVKTSVAQWIHNGMFIEHDQ
jgi:hypothetical protein